MNPCKSADDGPVSGYAPASPLLFIALSFCSGIFLSGFFKIPVLYPFLLSSVFLLAALYFSKKAALAHIGLYAAFLFLGAASYQNAHLLPPGHIYNLISEDPRKVIVGGMIADDPVADSTPYGIRTRFTLMVDRIKDGEAVLASTGLITVTDRSDPPNRFSFADEVLLEGAISRPYGLKNPGLFDYARYLDIWNIYGILKVKRVIPVDPVNVPFRHSAKRKGLVGKIKAAAYSVRGAVRGLLSRYVDEPYCGFLKAILIGDRSGLENAIKDDFVKTGTVHMIAISGLNVGLIAAILLMFFRLIRMPKRMCVILTVPIIIIYSFVAGSGAPIVRAVIIFCIASFGYLAGRQTDMMNSLSAAALIILLRNPKALFDPGFQLSFISVASMIAITPRINAIMKIKPPKNNSVIGRMKSYAISGASVSVAAWIGTWPVVASYFNIISPVAIFANLVMVPMLSVLTALSMAFMLAAPMCSLVANFMGCSLETVTKGLFFVNHVFAGIPYSYFMIPAPSSAVTVLYYGTVFLWLSPPSAVFRKLNIDKKKALIAALLVFNIFAWKNVIAAGRFPGSITFLDVGQGDSAFVEFPGGGNMLVDAGSAGEGGSFDTGRSVVAPYLWNRSVRRIDLLVVTHMHEDHLGGAAYLMNNFPVGCIIDNGIAMENSGIYRNYMDIISRKKIRRIIVRSGDRIGLPGGPDLFVLNPKTGSSSDQNNNSVVFKLVFKDISALFCGDIKEAAIENILKDNSDMIRSRIVKVPHHGGNLGDEETVKNFFSAVGAGSAVVSVGRYNRYNMPSEVTMKILTHSGANTYTTKDDGAIIVLARPRSYLVIPTVKNN